MKKIKNLLFSLPAQLIMIIILGSCFGAGIPEYVKANFLGFSLLVKAILVFVLPFIIFSFVFNGFSKLKSGAIYYTILLLSLVCISNFSGTIFSYFVTTSLQEFIHYDISLIENQTRNLAPSFQLELPKVCDNSLGLVFGLFLGLYASHTKKPKLLKLANICNIIANTFLNRCFIPILPAFVLGFVLKLQHTGILNSLLTNFLPLLLVLISIHIFYIGLCYLISQNFNIKNTIISIKNIIPAGLVGFSTMSSASALPVLLTQAEKNTKNPEFTKSVIPSVINTHMLGDALGIPLLALSLYSMYYGNMPDFYSYLSFSLSYVLAKFAAAGVPGGTIIVMIPVLESAMQFTPEMSGIILLIYLLLDPFLTCGNVFGNGMFSIVFENIWNKSKYSLNN